MTYLLLFSFDDHWEIGRHIMRMNTCGTLRLAALQEFRSFNHKYKHDLSDIDWKMKELQIRISSLFKDVYEIKRKGRRSKNETLKDIKSIGKEISNVHEDLGELDGVASGVQPRWTIGYLPFRAARSKYYLDRFGVLAPALQSGAIAGMQTYETFVQHRLIRAYTNIQYAADRYLRLRSQEAELRKEWMRLKSELHASEIEALQVTAEMFFIAVLFPYYLSHLVIQAMESDVHAEQGRVQSLHFWVNHVLASLHVASSSGSADPFGIVAVCLAIAAFILLLLRLETLIRFGGGLVHDFFQSVRIWMSPVGWPIGGLAKIIRLKFRGRNKVLWPFSLFPRR